MSTQPPNASWVMYPTARQQFTGLQTDVDPVFAGETAHVNGQNTYVNNGDRISIRPFGLQLFPSTGTASVASGGVRSMWTFRLRTGENIMLRAYGSVLEWFDENVDLWVNLRSGLGSDDFGFAEFNINANAESRLYHGNGVDDAAYWNGGHTLLNGALTGGEATITVDSTASFTAAGADRILRIGTTNVTYTGQTATTFTGCSGTPAAADRLSVAQAVKTDSSAPKGNIYMTAQNRLFIVPSVNKQLVQFSAYGDPTSWSSTTVLSSTATSAGAFNLIEGGGQMTAMTQDELSLYFFKDGCIYAATLSDSLYSLKLLKPFEGRSRAVGAIGKRGVFIGGNYTFVVTPDNQIKALQRIETIDYPQLKPISDIIQPTCDALDFSSLSGIAFKDYAFIACKSSSAAATNDTVLPFNINKGHWESPIIGWQVGEFTIYDDGNGEKLYFGDAISPNVWSLITDEISDGTYQVTGNWRSKQYDFGQPSEQKELEDVYVEGYISPTTKLTIKLLLDENGYTGGNETILEGTETKYIFDATVSNTFGLTPFGTERFGSSDDTSGKRKFRVHLKKKLRNIPFYNCQLDFSTSGMNQQWEVTRYGFLKKPATQPTRTSLLRDFS